MPNRDFIFYNEPVAVLALKPSEDEYAVVLDPNRPDEVQQQLDKILTQYRESDNLLAVLAQLLSQVDKGALVSDNISPFFDLEWATADQLTIIGGWVGWPRYHKYGSKNAVFGFAKYCDECYDGPPLAGFCNGVWDGCEGTEFGPYTFSDDDLYRRFLKSRIIQLYGDYRRETLIEAATLLFDREGDGGVMIVRENPGEITITIGRAFEGEEQAIIHLYRQVLPIAPGVKLNVKPLPVGASIFGFGLGWGSFCEGYMI